MRTLLITFLLAFCLNLSAADRVGNAGNFILGSPALTIQKGTVILADGQTVDVEDSSAVTFNSDSSVAADREFVLAAGRALGQLVVLVCFTSGTNALQLTDDSAVPSAGFHKLQGDWVCSGTAAKFDTLELQWSGSHWIERGRTDLQ